MGKESEFYDVEKILDKKMQGGKPMYLVKWKDWDEQNNTWEPYANIKMCKQILREFEESQGITNPDKISTNSKKISKEKKDDPEKEKASPGAFATDEAEKIIKCSLKENKLTFEVKWKAKENGVRPLNSVLSNEECRKIVPQIIIDYYQARITFKK